MTERLHLRKDLRSEPQLFGGEPCFVIKDPVSLAYFRLSPRQFQVLQLADGRTAPEICDAVRRQTGHDELDLAAVDRTLQRFVGAGLIRHEILGQGATLYEHSLQLKAARSRSLLGGLLYFRLPGIDPEPILKRIHPWLKWIYSPTAVCAAVALMLFAAGYTLVHGDEFLVRIRRESLEQFLSVQTILWLWLALGFSKVCHEFGHGLTCRHFGGECHEMGILFLVFSPCLYCDASDAWTMPDKWRRIAVSAGGIYVELVIASLATLTWWQTNPGVVHNIALALMTLCSLNTFLLNANPLMRFDGYYILSDLLEVPNLRQKAQHAWQTFVDRHVLGLETPAAELSSLGRRRWPFLAYAVGCWLYQWCLCVGILWFFYTVLKPYRLGSLGVMLAAIVAVQILLTPLWRNARRWRQACRRSDDVRWARPLLAACCLAGLAVAAVHVPIPHRVKAAATIRAVGQRSIVVRGAGRVESISVHNGDRVHAGDILAQLADPHLEAEIARLTFETRRLQHVAEKFAALGRPADEEATQESLTLVQKELKSRHRQRDDLTIRSAINGRIVFAERVPQNEQTVHGVRQLQAWTDSPLAAHNVGSHWDAGTRLGDVLPAEDFEAVLYVEQSDVPFVAVGQSVRLKLDAFPGATLFGTVAEIAHSETIAPAAEVLSTHGGELPTHIEGPQGSTGSAVVAYEARVVLRAGSNPDFASRWLLTGFRGRARIDCGAWTGWEWTRRRLFELFDWSPGA
jgi:putative peptide zinc metalloprotease protein